MKQKFKSILSVVVTVCVLLSSFANALSISAETQESVNEYYVAFDGAGDGTSADTAFGNIIQAISAAKTAGAADGENVTVIIPEGDTVTWGGSIPVYAFKLILKAQDTDLDGTVTQAQISDAKVFGGDVVLKNVALSNTTSASAFNGHNVTFDEGSGYSCPTVIYGNDGGTINVDGQTVIYRGGVWGSTTFITNNWTGGTTTYTDDLNIVVDRSDAAYGFNMTAGANVTTIYNEDVNLNFDIRQCKNTSDTARITFKQDGGALTHKGAVQIVYKKSLINDYFNTTLSEIKSVTPSNEDFKGVYEIVDATDISGDVIEFVSKTAGKYKIVADTERYNFTATGEDGTAYTAQKEEDGAYYITVPSKGKYTLTCAKKIETPELFVKSGADTTTADGTKAKPFADIGTAVSYAVNNKYTDGDTVTVTILDNETVEGADTVEWGTVATHDFKLIVKSDVVKATVKAADTLGGDTDFSNVTLIGTGTWPERNIFMGGYNVKFDENTTVTTDYLTYAANGGNTAISTAQTVEVKAPLSSVTVQMSNYYGGNRTFEKDVNLIFDNASSIAVISLNSHYGTTTFKKNINIDIRNASSYEYKDLQTGGGWTIDGAVQLIHKEELSVDNTLLTTYAPAGGIYEIINATEFDELLEFVPDTAGKYKIIADTEKYDYTVKDSAGNTVENAVADGYITLGEAGTYTVTASRKAATTELFVKYGADATTADGTKAKPFADIGTAVSYAVNNKYTDGDTVTVTILDNETVEGADTVEWGTVATHDFKLIVKSDVVKATVKAADTLGGDTDFSNVTLIGTGTWPERNIFMGGYNVKFDENTTVTTDYLTYAANSGNTAIGTAQTVEVKAPLSSVTVQISNYYGGNRTFEQDENLIFDNASSKAVISLNSHYGTTTFKKNINIDIRNATSYEYKDLGAGGGWTIDGAVQLIHKEELSVDNTLLTTYAPAGGIYEIINATEFDELLEFVPDTAGKYKIIADTEKYTYTVKDSAGNTVENAAVEQDGSVYIVLSKAGTYTVTASKKPAATEIFVKSGADTATADGTKDKPFADIGTAVSYAVNNDYTEGDTVTVTVLGTDEVLWGTTGSYNFDLIVSSETEGTAATVDLGGTVTLGGDTCFKDIALSDNKILFDGHDVTFDQGTTYSYMYPAYVLNSGEREVGSQTVIYRSGVYGPYTKTTNDTSGTVTKTGDLNIVVDNANASLGLYLVSNSGKTVYADGANLNFNIKNAKSVGFVSGGGTITHNGAIQVIHKSGFTFGNETLLTSVNPVNGTYWIVNDTEFDGLLEFIPGTAGKYKIAADISKTYDTSRYHLVVRDSNGNEYPVITENNESFVDVSATGGGRFTVSIEKEAEQKEYFVSAASTAETPDGTKDNPFTDIGTAVECAIDNDYTDGDTVTVTLLGTDEVSWGSVAAYGFELIIKSETEGTAANLNIPANTVMSGDICFKDITLADNNLRFGFHNVTFDEGTSYSALYPTYGEYSGNLSVESQTVTYRGGIYGPYTKTTNDYSGTVTKTGDLNIVVDNANASLGLYLVSNYGSTVYEEGANLNIDVKNAKSIGFVSGVSGTITHGGAIQVIHKPGFTFGNETLLTDVNPAKGIYWITNDTKYDDLLEFVPGTAGKYKVVAKLSEKVTLIAKDSEGNEYPVQYVDEVPYIILPEGGGTFTVSTYKEPESAVVYAKAGATDGDGSLDKPFATVAEAISAANKNEFIKGDTLTVKVIGTDTIFWGEAEEYTFTLNLQSATSDKATVDCSYSDGKSGGVSGDVVFKDIIVKGANVAEESFYFNNHNVSFENGANLVGVEYLIAGVSGTAQDAVAPKIVYSEAFSVTEFKLANGSSAKTYSGDFGVTFDNASAYAYMSLGANYGTTTYDNINIDIKNAAAAKIVKNAANSGAAYTLNGAVQIINSAGLNISASDEELANIDSSKKWIINNESGIKNLLSFADNTAGKFLFDAEKYVVTYTAESGTPTVCTSGELVLAAGVYTVTAEAKAYIEDEAVAVDGNTVDMSTYGENVNLVLDADAANVVFDFGTAQYKTVKINIKNASTVEFTGTPDITNSLEIIVNKYTAVSGSEVLDNATCEKWYIVDNTGKTDAISFTKEAGIFDYIAGYEVAAVSGETSYAPDGEELRLLPGEYSFNVNGQTEAAYGEYIDYGGGLANTYSKLSAGEKVNVAYYGGSVTAGTGSTDAENKSWRGRVGQWLENAFPNADVNNINLAYGGTSTKFGSYRLKHELLTRKPDLLFIEFSINDYYDTNADKSVAAMRFETIVRKVREALPECDIVTVLTTEVGLIEDLWDGNIHAEAQGHEAIAKEYNLPILYVGKSLAADLKTNYPEWSYSEYKSAADAGTDNYSYNAWSEYSTDIVHLTDKGYGVYYNVIKEFLTNSLIYGGYDGQITEHTVPEMINESLLDGDIQYIDASAELITNSEALGGTGYIYSSATGNLRGYQGYLQATAGSDSVFAIKFTGTELAVVEHSSLKSFMVKIDDGEYTEITPYMAKPVILATGLRYGEHTVYVKPICTDATGTMSWFQGFFVRNENAQTVKAGETKTADYYVGDKTNSIVTLPEDAAVYETVADAVSAAKSTDLSKGDTANIGVISMSVDWGTVEEYNFNTVITSASSTVEPTVNIPDNTYLTGNVEFGNVNVLIGGSYPGRNINFDGYDVIFGENTSLTADYIFYGKPSGDASYGGQTVELSCEFLSTVQSMNISNDSTGAVSYGGDVTVTVNNYSFDEPLALNSNYGSTTFGGNLNLNFSRASAVTLKDGAYSTDSTINGALQVIVNGSASMNSKEFIISKANNGNYWYVTDNCLKKGLLGFTEIAGVYTVADEGVIITATHTDGTVAVSENGLLDLSEKKGEWTVTGDYFEDFDDMSDFEYMQDWYDTNSNGVIENGKLIVDKETNILNSAYQIQNRNVSLPENQYFTFEFKGTNYVGTKDGGALIFAKIDESRKKGYGIYLSPDGVRMYKFETPTTLVTTGIDTTIPTTRMAVGDYASCTYNPDHSYRFGFSFVGTGESEAYIRLILIDITTNTILLDETYKDSAAYTDGVGIGFATQTPGDEYATSTAIDNFYASSEGFKEGTVDVAPGDINYDGVYDIRDLVYADEYLSDTEKEINLNKADKDFNGSIEASDIKAIGKEILNDINVFDFSFEGFAEGEADELRQSILNSADTAVDTESKYYVSSKAIGGGDGSENSPWTLTELNDVTANGEITSGAAVLFERGSVFRLGKDELQHAVGNHNSYGYILGVEGVTYGAYGEGDKPLFKASAKDYATDGWSKIEGTNIYQIGAEEIYVGNTDDVESNNSDDGATSVTFTKAEYGAREFLGERRAYTDGLYNLSRNGHFTYDTASKTLYLYCDEGNPATVYTSIEVGRVIKGIVLAQGVSNVTVDNLAFKNFGRAAVSASNSNTNITVTNCEIGYCGGELAARSDGTYNFSGNAVGFYNGGSGSTVSNNWIYHTFDSAISPQGDGNHDYSDFTVTGNLLEYNNADIELFDTSTKANTTDFSNWNISGNIMRFTSLGLGTSGNSGVRGIEGVIKANTQCSKAVGIKFQNNIIDTPGREIYNINNTTTVVDGVTTGIFKFNDGTGNSVMSGNTYYINETVRNTAVILLSYMTVLPSDGETPEVTRRTAYTAQEFADVIGIIDTSTALHWNGN